MKSFSSSRNLALAMVGSAGLLLAGNAFGWFASGMVADAQGLPLADVSVSFSSSQMVVQTDAEGDFQIGTSTSVRGRSGKALSASWSGTELMVRGLGEGPVAIALLDGLGRTRWETRISATGGTARFQVPAHSRVGLTMMRITGAEGTKLVRVLGYSDATGSVFAGRSSAETETIRFHKDGYIDTSFALESDSTTGIVVAMNAVRNAGSPGTWLGDTIYSSGDGRVLMESQVKLEFLADHQYVFSVTGQANWQPIVGDVFRGTGTWREIGTDSIEVALSSCTQPDTATLEFATFPAVVPFHEEGTGSETYFVTNPHKSTPCPAAGRVWKPWDETMSALLPVKMVLQDTTWDLSVIRQAD